jgi:hypothetical protein
MWKNRRWAGVTRTSPWLFEGGPENSLARGHDDVLIDPTLELDFGTEEQNEDDEPEGASIVPTSFWMGASHISSLRKSPTDRAACEP